MEGGLRLVWVGGRRWVGRLSLLEGFYCTVLSTFKWNSDTRPGRGRRYDEIKLSTELTRVNEVQNAGKMERWHIAKEWLRG